MTSLLHFEEKVHRKDLARAEAFPLLMPRLLSQVLDHLGFPEEPRIERRVSCPQVLSIKRSLYMPLSILLQQQDEEADDIAEDLPRGEPTQLTTRDQSVVSIFAASLDMLAAAAAASDPLASTPP